MTVGLNQEDDICTLICSLHEEAKVSSSYTHASMQQLLLPACCDMCLHKNFLASFQTSHMPLVNVLIIWV